MQWIVLSLFSAVSCSGYAIVQKYAFQKQFSNFLAFAFWGALFHLGISLFILATNPLPIPWTSLPVLTVLAFGVFGAGNTLLLNRVMQKEEEVSRIVPVVDTYPVFIAILAVVLLGESLTPVKWLAMALVICGAFLASWHQSLPGDRVKLNASFILLVIVSVGIAVSSIATKYALGHLSFWHVYALAWIGSAPAIAVAAHALRGWNQVKMGISSRRAVSTTLSAHILLFVACISAYMAFAIGPVSLSSAIMASRPIIVLAYATLVGFFIPKMLAEKTSGRVVLQKSFAVSMVTVGVGVMALT